MLVLLVTGESLSVDLLPVAPLALLAMLSVMGVGFVFLQFGPTGLVAVPVDANPLLRYLPLVQGNVMLGRAMREGVPPWRFPLADLGSSSG